MKRSGINSRVIHPEDIRNKHNLYLGNFQEGVLVYEKFRFTSEDFKFIQATDKYSKHKTTRQVTLYTV